MISSSLRETEIDFFEMRDPVRNVYEEPVDRALIRTADVYQIENEVGTIGYSDTLLAVIANYRNSGRPEGFNARCTVGKAKKGEAAMKLFAVIDLQSKTFLRAGFQTRGCLAVTACASIICTMIEGKTFEKALEITPRDVAHALDGVPTDKVHALYFAVEGVRALIGDFYFRQGMTLAEFDALGLCDDDGLPCIMCEQCSLRSTRIDELLNSMGVESGDQHE